MSMLDGLRHRLHVLLHPHAYAAEIDEERRFHLDLDAQQRASEGLGADDSRHAARRRFGNATYWSEEHRGSAGLGHLDPLRQDIRYAARTLRRSPGFTLVAVLTLGLGIAATTTIFSVVDAVLLRPLPYQHPHQLTMLLTRYLPESGSDYPYFAMSWPEYAEYRQQSRVLSDVGAFSPQSAILRAGNADAERVSEVDVTSNVFRLLGVAPIVGRSFGDDDGRPGAPCAIAISHALWVQQFGGDPRVAGRSVSVDGAPCTIASVMPDGFGFPSRGVDVWRVLGPTIPPRLITDRSSHWLLAVGRIAPHHTLADAEAESRAIAARWREAYPTHHRGHFVILSPLTDFAAGPMRAPLTVLFAAVGLVLAIVCANVAGLLLVRGEGRRREMAVRASLGASRRRLVAQLLTENALLTAAGGALGIGASLWGIAAIRAPITARVGPTAIGFDSTVMLFIVSLSVLTGLTFGIVPALRLATGRLEQTLRIEGRGNVGHARRARARRLLIIGELGLALTLVTGAALLVDSFSALRRVPLGFDPAHIATVRVTLTADAAPDASRTEAIVRDIRAKIAETPGVQAAGAISSLPLADGATGQDDFVIEGRPVPAPGEPSINAGYFIVTPGALEALRVPLERGRMLAESDVAGSPLVAVVNDAAGRRFWPGRDPIGQRIHWLGADSATWVTIVGVVGDVRSVRPSEPARPAIYVPHAQLPRPVYDGRQMTFVVRTASAASATGSIVARAVHDVAPSAAVDRTMPMEQVVEQANGNSRLVTMVMSAFGVSALLLAALGVYGLVAYSARARRGEYGVRLALGATAADLFRLVLREAAQVGAAGVAVGLIGVLTLAGSLRGLLYGVTATDPWVIGGVSFALLAIVLVASIVPARRAARIDAIEALRSE